MKRRKSKGKAPRIRLVGWQVPVGAAVAAAGLVSATALAAPGELDPSFADVGRQSDLGVANSTYSMRLVSAEALEDDDVLFGGGGEYCYWGCYVSMFLGRLGADGELDAAFGLPVVPGDTLLSDTVAQADGKLVGVGSVGSKLAVFRTLADGTADPGFGASGFVTIADPLGIGAYYGFTATLDPDGRIVVAGVGSGKLLVARLESNGARDATFGTDGVALITDVSLPSQRPLRIARASDGGYRVIYNRPPPGNACTIIGLTASGAVDASFGTSGLAVPHTAEGAVIECSSMAPLADGRIVATGTSADGKAQAVRLLANGTQDATFDARAALQSFGAATAVAVGPSGKLVVGVRNTMSLPGARVVRLLGDGRIDNAFGSGGVATIDVQSARAVYPDVVDLQVLDGERVLVAGNSAWADGMFVARLLGDAAGGSPGVLGITAASTRATEQDGRATLVVRRTGGRAGSVAVSYSTATPYGLDGATAGADFTVTTGRLEWADGDDGEREIVVPINADGDTERPELFAVDLERPEGGAGLGTSGADIEVAGSGYPAGHFAITADQATAFEGLAAQFRVSRRFYSTGTVSVTVRVAAATTASKGTDFASPGQRDQWQDVVLTWRDGESGDKFVSVSVLADKANDPDETLVLELASPAGGAVLDSQSSASVQLINRVSSGGSGGGTGSSGGGQFGGLGALLLGLTGAWRRWRRPHGGATNA